MIFKPPLSIHPPSQPIHWQEDGPVFHAPPTVAVGWGVCLFSFVCTGRRRCVRLKRTNLLVKG